MSWSWSSLHTRTDHDYIIGFHCGARNVKKDEALSDMPTRQHMSRELMEQIYIKQLHIHEAGQ